VHLPKIFLVDHYLSSFLKTGKGLSRQSMAIKSERGTGLNRVDATPPPAAESCITGDHSLGYHKILLPSIEYSFFKCSSTAAKRMVRSTSSAAVLLHFKKGPFSLFYNTWLPSRDFGVPSEIEQTAGEWTALSPQMRLSMTESDRLR